MFKERGRDWNPIPPDTSCDLDPIIGSRSQEVSGELDKSAETSAMVAGWKKDSSGGLEAGGRCGEEVVLPDRIEDRSL